MNKKAFLPEGVEPEGLHNELSRRIDPDGRTRPLGTCFTQPVNYPVLTGRGFRASSDLHSALSSPFGVFTYPQPLPLVKARAMFLDAFALRCAVSTAPAFKEGNIPYGFISRPVISNSPPLRTASPVEKDDAQA